MSKKLFMKPLKALASPGIYLFGKYNQYKRERQQSSRPNFPTENEFFQLNMKIDKLLNKLNGNYVEMAATPEEECVICVNAKAVMQTYPCGHKVVCRRCFVKTIQIALSQRTLPLCCVICRTKISRLKHTESNQTSSSLVPSFHYRQFSCVGSKRYSEVLRSSTSLEKNPWPSRNKYSRSLPGINGSSFRMKSSVNRSHSAVVYRQPGNSMRKCYRSCSLSSCSSDRGAKSKPISNKSYQQVNYDQHTNLQKDNSATQTNKRYSYDSDRRPADEKHTNSSREKLIRQFQRDFKEGQLSTRSASIRKKPPSQNVPSYSPKRYLSPTKEVVSSNLKSDPKQTNAGKRRMFEKKKSMENMKCQEKSNKSKDKQNTKTTTKLMKSEVHSRSKLFHKMGKNLKVMKKGKIRSKCTKC